MNILICTLEEEFLPYLAGWEASVRRREGFTMVEQNNMMFSAETRLGIYLTGIIALIIGARFRCIPFYSKAFYT